jgi:hypothetical protein
MSEETTTPEATETAAEVTDPQATDPQDPDAPKPTETVEFWKQKAREQEKRAKENAEAAKRLSEIEDANKSEAQRAADALAAAEERARSAESRAQSLSIATEFQLGPEDASLLEALPDEDSKRALAARLAKQEPTSSSAPRPDLSQGSRGNTAPRSTAEQFAAAVESSFTR